MTRLKTNADTYRELDAYLGAKSERTIGHNTRLVRDLDGAIGVRLHATTVVTFHADDTITLDSGGWRTVTTKDRINAMLPRGLRVSSERGVWTVYRRGSNPATVSQFYDGMRFTINGEMVTDVLADADAEMRKIKREITRYVKLYDDATIARLVDRAAAEGTAGDCLICQIGPAMDGADHLTLHMEEGYTMASLMVNALKHVGYQDFQLAANLHHNGEGVRRAIRRYMTETLTTSHGARPAGRKDRTVGFLNSVS